MVRNEYDVQEHGREHVNKMDTKINLTMNRDCFRIRLHMTASRVHFFISHSDAVTH